ncbi:MAG: hypothetical protein ISS02_00680 [Candidatus Portnoybacteria bacterium]|nr:hypothetical protein [Candidatus Portnoybacteria bacterium]
MILAIGNSNLWELEAFDLVRQEIEKKGQKAVIFKQDKCLEGEYLNYIIDNKRSSFVIEIDGEEYNAEQFSAVWNLKPIMPEKIRRFEPIEYRHFIKRQFYAMQEAIWTMFANKKWIDNPWTVVKAEDKIYQLNTAIESGFNVPDTLVSSNPKRVSDFYCHHDKEIIIKMIRSSPMNDKVIYTNVVTDKYMEAIESVKMSPSIFQEVIKKEYELRITVVGDNIFPVKIDSQVDSLTSLDWRKKPKLNDTEVELSAIEIPDDVCKKIKLFMNKMNLNFGCIDMAVTPEGKYIFFEINPNGQWYFVQLKTHIPIAKAIAKLLIN